MPESAQKMIWLVLFLPLVGSVIQALLGGKVVASMGPEKGKRLMGALAVLFIGVPFAIGAYITLSLSQVPEEARTSIPIKLYDWISIQGLSIPFEVVVDPLSMTMVLIITGIGALIHLYATGYMSEERDYPRFFTYLNLFISSMLILVLGGNLALMFIGWEGVGLCSYLLIGFWYKDVANAKAANKAFIVNRIGDWGLTLGMFLLMTFMMMNADKLGLGSETRWLSYDVLLPNAVKLLSTQPAIATTIALLLFIGACGKSAQFPLYFWLPDAMAGPTPVSALIHAATMVTAGVFMLNRVHVLFELSPVASAVVCAVGAFTALFAALIAFGQTDIKKVLAYSTVSQLGFMFIACGAGAYWVGMFHVTTHAFFKALLFLGSGAVIHAMAHNQDMRNYGKLRKYLPWTFATMMIGYLAISGIPPLAGFFSKEGILGSALAGQHAVVDGQNIGVIAGWVGLFVAMLTAWYMTRMTMLTFFSGNERWMHNPQPRHAEDHHADHADAHGHYLAHHDAHGPDTHGFFLSSEEVAARVHHEHHHELEGSHRPHEVPPSMLVPLVVLAFLSLVGGYWMEHNEVFEHWLSPSAPTLLGEVSLHPHGIPLMGLSIAAAVLGILFGAFTYIKGLPKREGWDMRKWSPFRRSAADQFGYDAAVVNAGVGGGGDLATATWKYLDAGVIDGAVNGIGWLTGKLGCVLRQLQTGYVRGYALMMLIGSVGVLGFILYAINRAAGAQ